VEERVAVIEITDSRDQLRKLAGETSPFHSSRFGVVYQHLNTKRIAELNAILDEAKKPTSEKPTE